MILLFNGPPGSGKDVCANYVAEQHDFIKLSFKEELIYETCKYYQVLFDWFMDGYEDRSKKERKEELLGGISKREALINVSENLIKPYQGKDYFGKCAAERIEKGKNYVFSDSGFVEEAKPLINTNELVILVRLIRDNCDFSRDSRRYLAGLPQNSSYALRRANIDSQWVHPEQLPIPEYTIVNNGTLEELRQRVDDVLRLEGYEDKNFLREPLRY